MLWAHVDVLRTVKDGNPTPSAFWLQSRDWNPAITDQPDDYLDAVAGAVTETPERFKGKVGKPTAGTAHDWRPTGGRSEEHTSELQSLMRLSYAVLRSLKKNTQITHHTTKLT